MGYIASGLALYVLFVTVLFLTQRSLLYHPDQTVPDPEAFDVPEMTAVRVPTRDGFDLLAWWRAPRNENSPVLAIFHGNAGHIGTRAHKVRDYLDAGYGVLLLSYRYNAGSAGNPSEANLFEDARAGLSFLKKQGISESSIAVFGESLGTGVAVAMAATHKVGAVVLEAPYSSMTELAQHHYWYAPSRWLVRDRFDSLSRVGDVYAPILILHGEKDTVIPPQFGRRLYEAISGPKEVRFFAEGGHSDLLEYGMASIVVDFLERTLSNTNER